MALDFKRYDSRGYKTVDVKEGYTQWAKSYDDGFDSNLDRRLLENLKSIDWTTIDTVVDLACGTGRTGKWLKDHRVKVLDGVDLSNEMMARAKARGIYRQLLNEDIRRTSLPSATYDLVTNSLSSEHLPKLEPLFQEAQRLLKPGGHFVLLGYHPHFQLKGIPTHFDDETGESIAITNHVHLISDFMKAGFETNLALTEFDENVVDENWPAMKKHFGHPISFIGVWRKS
ncbi:MAG: class I SAM-dependent methyltransferase [Bdellovibrionota bacterium]